MSYPGASSGRSKVTPFRSDSFSPGTNGSGRPGTRDGMGKDGKGFSSSRRDTVDQRRTPMREVYADELAWAAKHLPGEYGPFVALGIRRIRRQGGKLSVESVMAYLRELGRDAASRERS